LKKDVRWHEVVLLALSERGVANERGARAGDEEEEEEKESEQPK